MKPNNKSGENWSRFINSKCPICKNTPSYPVRFNALKCRCRNQEVYCLTCLRDNVGINDAEKTMTNCPTCDRKIADLPKKAQDIYYPLHHVADLYDEKYGEIVCPRKCEWKGFRFKLREHMSDECMRSMRKCQICRKSFPNIAYRSHELSCGMEIPIADEDGS